MLLFHVSFGVVVAALYAPESDAWIKAQNSPCDEVVFSIPAGAGTEVVTYTWDRPVSATGYRLYRTDAPGTWSGARLRAIITDPSVTSYVDTGAPTTSGNPREYPRMQAGPALCSAGRIAVNRTSGSLYLLDAATGTRLWTARYEDAAMQGSFALAAANGTAVLASPSNNRLRVFS